MRSPASLLSALQLQPIFIQPSSLASSFVSLVSLLPLLFISRNDGLAVALISSSPATPWSLPPFGQCPRILEMGTLGDLSPQGSVAVCVPGVHIPGTEEQLG